ncbi:MAG: NUDIX hydrolase [Actinophytocola sp.]|uniref:NUDIX domain-containing protein n=1 Tax=Actinophytocola sp. TaxID=1872138 RepID=UPI00132A8F65|nr:NUDIX domain-containing protein [Actinophytocola sp.]MPZ79683.1 NUDIX hydrolase [Actinophytocola sp.]
MKTTGIAGAERISRQTTFDCGGVARRGLAQGWLRSAVVTQTVDVGFAWCPRPVPAGMPVVQVYGWLLDKAGRVLVQDTGDGFNLPGGSPEPVDVDMAATVVREAMEESQVTVVDVVYLGYEQVERAGVPQALVRTVGRIGEFRPRHPDPDGGRLLRRLLTSLQESPDLLGWGRSGLAQARAAARIARTWRGLPTDSPVLARSYVD